jgi:polar amino acid transport system substrate-binding protein
MISSRTIQSFVPSGRLRAGINLGNPILAKLDNVTSKPVGVSVDLASAFALRLGVEVEFAVFETAGKAVEALMHEDVDVGFFAIDPLRGQGISFTPAYVLIEGSYMVRADSDIQSNDEVDRTEHRVTVGKGSAYDLFLTRELKRAEIVRAPSSQAVVDMFINRELDVAAGVKQQLEADMKRYPNLRLLPGRFMVIQQAMGVAKSRGSDAADELRLFIESAKSIGLVQESLSRHRVEGASVAPKG